MIENEILIELADAAKAAPGAPHVSAIWRWCRKGIKVRSGDRLRLDHVRVGGRIFTSRPALARFFKALAEADAAHFDRQQDEPPPERQRHRIASRREKSTAKSSAALAAAGWA